MNRIPLKNIGYLCMTVLLTWSLSACQQEQREEPSTTVTISGTATQAEGKQLAVFYGDLLDYEKVTLGEAELDSSGAFSMSFELEGPTEAKLSVGKSTIPLFLKPGTSLEITFDADDMTGTTVYEGPLSAENNYALAFDAANDKNMSNFDLYKLSPEAFAAFTDSVQTAHQEYMNSFFADLSPDPLYKQIAENKIFSTYAQLRNRYPMYHTYFNQLPEEVEVPEGFHDYRDKIALDREELLVSYHYTNLIEIYTDDLAKEMRKEMQEEQQADESEEADDDENKPSYQERMMNTILTDNVLKGQVKEFALTKLTLEVLNYSGLEEAMKILDSYEASVSHAPYLTKVSESRKKWEALASGNPAPVFEYPDLEGNTVSLADLRGKVVYLDIWATWCGPCLGEIPNSIKLKEHFAGNDKIAMVYVSIDENKAAWEKMLGEKPEFQGIHLHATGGWGAEINQQYLIKAIPRYILIDQAGNIVSAQAKRPSQTEALIAEIEGLLAQNEVVSSL